MPPAKRISGNHGEWYMGLPASEPGSSRLTESTFEDEDDQGLMDPISPTGGSNKTFSFVCGKSAVIAPILEDDTAIDRTEDDFGSEGYECSLVLEDLLEVDDCAAIPDDIQNLPKTLQAIRILTFLKEQLSVPFSDSRFTAPDIAAIHRRHPGIVATCKEWMPYLELAETEGMKFLVVPLYQFFQAGQVLAWIEVMATAKQLQIVLEFAKGLRRWLERITENQYEMVEKINVIHSWTKDLEHLVPEYNSCLKRFPSEVYFIAPTFLPEKSPLRSQIETLATLRGATPAKNFSECNQWEPFKCLNLPASVTSDPSFISSSLSRFTFNRKSSLLAFRGANQVIVFSAYTGAVIGTFKFPKREIACVAFSPRASMIAVSFSTSESQLIDLNTGTLLQELSSPSPSYTNGNGVQRSSSVSLGKSGKRLHNGHKSLELGLGTEEMNFAAAYLEERTSAVGPDGVHALLTRDGIFKVSDETGDTLFFRRIRVDIETYKPSSQRLATLKRSINGRWGAENNSSKSLSSSRNSFVSEKLSSIQHVYSGEVQYRCYDICTRMREDMVINNLLQKSALGGQKSAESGFEISFNNNGTVAILHTTNAFAAGIDVLHIANFSTKEIPRFHIIYPSPAQPISGFSVNSEGDLIALCPQSLDIISVVRLSHGFELYRIDPRQLQIEPVVGLSFAPGSGSMLMTAHSGKYAMCWDIGRLAENPGQVATVNAKVLWNAQQHCITSDGNTVLLNRVTEKYIRPLIIQLSENPGVKITLIKSPLFSRCQDQSSPMALASGGQSAVIGQYLYVFSPKIKSRKLSIPKGGKIVRAAMMSQETVAFGLLLRNTKSQVRVHNWSSKKYEFHDWIPSPDTILNIWALSFNEDGFLAVGVQLRSNGLNKFSVCLINRLKGGNLVEVCRTKEWEIAKPIQMAFGSDRRLVVLANGSSSQEKSSPYCVFVFDIPSKAPEGFQATPVIRQLVASTQITPSMTSEGHVFYLGREKDEGWIMKLNDEETQNNEGGRRIAWCPLSWRSVGNLSFLCASKGDRGKIICLNKVLGIAVVNL